MAEYEVMDALEIPEGSRQIVTVSGIVIGIFNINGKFYAYQNVCPHKGEWCSACEGTLTGHLAQGPETNWDLIWDREGEILYCPSHATDFDILTGESIARKPMRLQSYPIKVEDGKIKITLSEPDN
jgi:nitrite reductase/ring-hydroxylating ferredoxin subunit|tara:strand:- start:504 stop:881 length:378 start_codon:yes stop_codon:yes gene_type:complete